MKYLGLWSPGLQKFFWKIWKYIGFGIKNNEKDPKFKVSDHVRISKYKNISAKDYIPTWSEEVFVIRKVKNKVLWLYVISDIYVEKIVGKFDEKNYKRQIKKNLKKKK